MNQKITLDLLRLAGLLGFCRDSKNRHAGREIDSVFDTLASDVSSLLKSYQEIEDQNLKLRQDLRSCRCRGARSAHNGPNDKKRKRRHQSTSSSGRNYQQRHSHRAVVNANGGNSSNGSNGGAAGNISGAYGYGSVARTNGSNNFSHTNGNSNSSGSKSSSSHQIVVPHDVMVKAQAEMRKAGYELLDQLGHGGFGLVYRGRPLNNTPYTPSQEVAIKFTKCSDIHLWTTLPNSPDQIPLEAAALVALESVTSVVDLLGYGQISLGNDDVFTLVMEKPAGCLSFDSYLRRQAPLTESMVFFFLEQLVSIVMAIHRCGWVHGDLKPSNLLICDQDQLKAIDYGLAREVVNDQCIVPAAGGTLLWNIPPERINGAYDLVKSTVWSVGVIYYCMVFGKLPFPSLRKAKNSPLRWHHNISSGAKFMLQRLLDPEPNRRVAIQDLEQLIQTNAPPSGVLEIRRLLN
ncbi:Serine/threonine-protein kinase pim-1 [Apostichopus japonicus]|uniref:non-specific serine/threonine protein kinase n=1 Tax=Stichopus japonicus TaxID=307972 RepID=A0A2G8JTF8_STIJA|nr:Serine/threonine-protein kinase pim-1 [Apostichopus japonicus]